MTQSNWPSYFRFLFAVLSIFTILFILAGNVFINSFSQRHLYHNIEQIPYNEYGLLLGTSRFVRKGVPNEYFRYRIDAAIELLKHDKIKKIIVSGDNRKSDYNEPAVMRNELLKGGIADSLIILEKGGYRTLQSIRNLRDSLCISRVTIITQHFHNQRAVFLAYANDIQAIGFCARDIGFWRGLRIRLREYFAKPIAYAEVRYNQ